jgi:phosphoribosylformylglycinamidine (FGAM) synthase-like amidotransferase family enzyme
MAKVMRDSDKGNVTHLRKAEGVSLCGAFTRGDVLDGCLTCPTCAAIALTAIETSTKGERKVWRSL